MDEKAGKQDPVLRVLLSLGRIILVAALIIYLLYHLTNGFSKDMKTLIVKPVTEEMSVTATGMIVRDEKKLYSSVDGVISYLYEDGEKVRINSKVANVYSGISNGETVSRIAEIDRAIELLEAAEIDENTRISDAQTAKKEISSLIFDLSNALGHRAFADVMPMADSLLAATVRRDTILGGVAGTGETALSLKAERESLVLSLSGEAQSVRTPVAGYFYSYTDGGEDAFDFASAESLTLAEYRVKASLANENDGAIGKIVLSPAWYLLLPVSEDEAKQFKAGQSYDVRFGGDGITLSMKLEAKNADGGESLLVFKSSRMPSGFLFDREQNVSVTTGSITGYKIPASALRVLDGVVGVYVQSGNNIKFRVVEQIYESGAYTFVRTDTEAVSVNTEDDDPENDRVFGGIALYDAVIVGGAKDLSPDRIID